MRGINQNLTCGKMLSSQGEKRYDQDHTPSFIIDGDFIVSWSLQPAFRHIIRARSQPHRRRANPAGAHHQHTAGSNTPNADFHKCPDCASHTDTACHTHTSRLGYIKLQCHAIRHRCHRSRWNRDVTRGELHQNMETEERWHMLMDSFLRHRILQRKFHERAGQPGAHGKRQPGANH